MVKCKKCGTDYKVSCHVCYPDPPTENEKRILQLEEIFRHPHVSDGVGSSCKRCGLDLRDKLHLTAL